MEGVLVTENYKTERVNKSCMMQRNLFIFYNCILKDMKIFTEKVYIYGNCSLIFSQILYFEWFSLVY